MSTPKDPDLIAKERQLKQMKLHAVREEKRRRHAAVKEVVDLYRQRGWKLSFTHRRSYDPYDRRSSNHPSATGGRTILYIEKAHPASDNPPPMVLLQFEAVCSPHDHYEKLYGNELCLARFRAFLRSGVMELLP